MYIHTCSRLAARFASWTTPSWTEAIQPLEPCSPFHRSKTSCPEWPIRSFLSFDGRPPEPALLPTVKHTRSTLRLEATSRPIFNTFSQSFTCVIFCRLFPVSFALQVMNREGVKPTALGVSRPVWGGVPLYLGVRVRSEPPKRARADRACSGGNFVLLLFRQK